MSVESESSLPPTNPNMIKSFEEWQADQAANPTPETPVADSPWAEKPKEAPLTMAEIQERRDRADGVVEMEPEESMQAEAFVNDILTKAREKQIIGSDGNVYSEADIKDRLATVAAGLNKGKAADEASFKALLQFIPRSNGLRDSIKQVIETEGLGAAFTDKITKIYWQIEREKGEALRSEEKLKEVGDESLEASGVSDPADNADSFEAKAAEAARSQIIDKVPTQAEITEAMGAQEPAAPEAEKPKTTNEAVAELPIEMQRSVKDYEMYMSTADRDQKINGYNRDVEDNRRRANDILHRLPGSVQDLAKRYRAERKDQ